MKKSTFAILAVVVVLMAVSALSYVYFTKNLDKLYTFNELIVRKKKPDVFSYLTPEECYKQGGRIQIIENGQTCEAEEDEVGDVIGYQQPFICCLPMAERRQEIVKEFLTGELNKDIIDIVYEIELPAYVRGKVLSRQGSEIFLASKFNGKWSLNFIGKNIDCRSISKFEYPANVVPECRPINNAPEEEAAPE